MGFLIALSAKEKKKQIRRKKEKHEGERSCRLRNNYSQGQRRSIEEKLKKKEGRRG